MDYPAFARPHFIANSRARGLWGQKTTGALRGAVTRAFPSASWRATAGPGDAIALARAAVVDGADLVVAVGGDGTVNEVANGLLTAPGPPPVLGILPAGSGSDFARSLGIPRRPSAALALLGAGVRRMIDVGEIVCAPLESVSPPDAARRFFVNMAGCGASARVAQRFNQRRIPGAVGYAAAAALTTFTYHWPTVTIETDEDAVHTSILNMLFVCNGDYCGGGMHAGRGARLDDGRFLVIEAAGFGRLRTVIEWPRLYRGRLAGVRGVRTTAACCVRVTSRHDVLVDCDGEVCGRLPASYTIRAGALTVCAPVPAR